MIQRCSRSGIIVVSEIGPGLLCGREQGGTAGKRLSSWEVVHCGGVERRRVEDVVVENRVVFLVKLPLSFPPVLHMQGIRRLI